MREKMMRFMEGRYGGMYGNDRLNKALSVTCIVLFILSVIIRKNVFWYLALFVLIYEYYRMFSRNIQRRYGENEWFVRHTARFSKAAVQRRIAERKIYRIFRCPNCRQKARVPKGHGKICITCPKCSTQFIKKS
jgi:hypothetical protein